MSPKGHEELCEVCRMTHENLKGRVIVLEQHDSSVQGFMAWWDRGNIGQKIEETIKTADQMVFLNKAFFALLLIAGTGAGIWKALH